MPKYFSINFLHPIRPVTLLDAVALQRDLWPAHSPEAVQDLLGRILTMTQQDRAVGLVMVNQSSNKAFAYGQITRWPRVAEISDLAVAVDQRSQGFGSALIEALSLHATRWHLPQIEIGVALSNTRALALYRRLGFADSREILINLGQGVEPVLYLTRLQKSAPTSKMAAD